MRGEQDHTVFGASQQPKPGFGRVVTNEDNALAGAADLPRKPDLLAARRQRGQRSQILAGSQGRPRFPSKCFVRISGVAYTEKPPGIAPIALRAQYSGRRKNRRECVMAHQPVHLAEVPHLSVGHGRQQSGKWQTRESIARNQGYPVLSIKRRCDVGRQDEVVQRLRIVEWKCVCTFAGVECQTQSFHERPDGGAPPQPCFHYDRFGSHSHE